MTTTIRIQTRNNSTARAFDLLDGTDAKCRHNGGKLVIATVDAEDVPAVVAILDESYQIASYEVVS